MWICRVDLTGNAAWNHTSDVLANTEAGGAVAGVRPRDRLLSDSLRQYNRTQTGRVKRLNTSIRCINRLISERLITGSPQVTMSDLVERTFGDLPLTFLIVLIVKSLWRTRSPKDTAASSPKIYWLEMSVSQLQTTCFQCRLMMHHVKSQRRTWFHLGRLVHLVHLVHLGHLVHLVHQAHLVHLGHLSLSTCLDCDSADENLTVKGNRQKG